MSRHTAQSLPVVRRLPVSAGVERQLRQRIIDGVYRAHVYLPSERQLAKDFSTSRVTVAHALSALERDGLVLRTPGRGTRVLPVMDRLAQSKVGIVHGELLSMETVTYRDSLLTLQGVRDALERLDFPYELVSVEKPPEAELLLSRFGAVLFVESCYGDGKLLRELEQRKIPVVVAKLEDETATDDLEVSATWVDHLEPIRQAVRTFVNLGHRRIGFVGRDANFGFHGKAREGYLQGLKEAGLDGSGSMIGVCEKTDALSGYLAALTLLSAPTVPTAIVAARDSLAEGVCRAIKESGLVVGHQVSVIGFDDTTWPEGREFLTTFGEACYEMGSAAAEMLVERIVSGWKAPERKKFDAPFILRRTAGPNFE